jgi:plastocyanin
MAIARILIALLLPVLAAAGATQAVTVRVASGSLRGRVSGPENRMVAPRPLVSGLAGMPHDAVDRRRVVVYLEPTPVLTAVPTVPTRSRMDQRDEQFVPRLLAITTGSTVEFPNSDTTFHNVFSLSRPRTFDLGRYPPGKNGAIRFDRPGIVPVFCDIHSHMSAYILVFSHPFFAISDGGGRYSIADIPAGTYGVSVWSELGQSPSRRVTIGADSTVEADFEISRAGS